MLEVVRILNPTDYDLGMSSDSRSYVVPAHGTTILSVRDYRSIDAINPSLVVEAPMLTGESRNVARYGAIGDGKTDDSDAIQRAFDAAYDDGGGEVFFPAGEYECSRGLFVRDGVGIVGEGDSSLIMANYGIVVGGGATYIRDVRIRR